MRIVWSLLLLLGTASLAVGHRHRRLRAVGHANCAQKCSGVSGELHYEEHKEYVYDTTSTATLKVPQGKYQSVVTQRARAHIVKHSPCEFSLKLSGVSLTGMDVPKDWARTLEAHSLRFGFDDGEIVGVCPTEADPVWAVNLKRAVLSAFQTNHESDWETDVVGECPVEHENRKAGPALSIKTTKNIAACHRGADISGIRAVPYRFHSNTQTVPTLEATQKCERDVRDGILKKVSCTENHRLPAIIEAGGSGDAWSVHVVAQMTHTSTQPSNAKAAPFSKHETIKFDHSDDMHTPKTADVRQVKTNVDTLCAQTHRVDQQAAMHFVELVHNLRGLSQQEITSISNKDCTAFVDGLAMCGSTNCIAHLATLINHGAASESVFSALAFVHNPDKAVIDHVASFIARVPHQGLLGVTSLVQSYCISHPHCGTEPGVKRIIDALLQKIPRGCTVGKHFAEVEKAVYVLKAIGNIGNEDTSLTLLNDCVANEKNPLEVQLSAIDALRRKPCNDKRNKNIDHLFFDEEEDEEVRIAAFAQLMECADEAIVDKVIDHFHNETSNQVGSYVWSYLNAKRRSSKPGNEELQRILKKKHIPQRFDLDPRRFSRFYEVGYFDPENNYGGHMDSSVIFSPKGYIPRGVNFNFTIHLFGKSLNILELDARAEGLEQLDNELFGADGYISNPNGHVFHDKKFQSHNAKVNQLKVLFQKKGDFIEDQLSGSLSARMFGDDVKYFAFEKDHFFENAKEYFALDKTLPKLAKEMKYEKSRNLMLVDVRRLLPTVCGLPLQVALNAAVKSKVSYKAKLNLVDLLHQRPNADALLEAQPSASVFATLSVSWLAAETRSGVRCESTLYSATSVSGEVSLKDGKKFLAKINLPDDDAKLVHYERKMSRIDNNRITAIPTPPAPGSKHHYCTSSTTGKVTGLKMCAEWQNNYPSVLAEVSVEKVDPQLKSYELKIDHESSDAHQKMLMSVDTPGSKVNRKMETSFDLSIPRKTLKMNVITPFKKIMVDGNLVEKRPRQEYDAKLKLNIDDRKHYDLDGSFKAGTHQGRTKYTLTAKTLAGSAETADLKTEIEYSGRKSPYASVDFHLDKVFEKPIVFKTLMNLAGPHYQSKLEYSGPKFNGKLDGDLHHTGGFSYKGSVKGDYQVGNEKKHLLNIGSEQTFKMKGKDHNLKNSISVESSSLGKYDYTVYSKREGNDMKNAIEVDYRGKKSTVNVDIKRNANDLYTAIATAKCDRLGVNHKANIAYQNKFPMQFQLKVDAETPTMKNIHAGVEYQMRSSPKWTFNGKARLAYPGKEFVATEHIDEQVAGKYKAVTMVQWDRNGKVDVNSEILFKPKEHEYSIDSVVNVAGMREPIHLKKHVKYRQDHYNVHWQAKHGNVIVYEIVGSTNGRFGAPQKIDLDVKSQKFDPKFHYHLAGNVQPTADTMKLDAVIKKDNRQVAKGDILVPKNLKAPSQKYSGHFDWTYENKPYKASGEYVRNKNAQGSTHLLTIDGNNDVKGSLQFDLLDKVHLKCDVQKGGRRVSLTEMTAGPLKWDHFELDGHVDTDHPLPKKSVKTKAAFSYRANQVNYEGRVESDGERYAVEGKWRKQQKTPKQRQYVYSLALHAPQGSLSVGDDVIVEDAFTIRRMQSDATVKVGRDEYKMLRTIENQPQHFKFDNELTSNTGKSAKSTLDYTHVGGNRKLDALWKYNEKQVQADIETLYEDRKMKIKAHVISNTPKIIKFTSNIGCEKVTNWNCEVEGNVNDNYVLQAHEKLSPQQSDVGYLLKLDKFLDNEGKLEYHIDKRAQKFETKALMRNSNRKYHFDMNVDRDHGSLKLQTPTQLITDAQMRVVRKGPEEFEISSQAGGAARGKVKAHLKTADNDQLFQIQITDIKEPFELMLKNTKSGNRQTSQVEFTLDPLASKKTYGAESVIEDDGGKFRGMLVTLKHPKRSVHVELRRPAHNKYLFSIQPKMGSARRPTVAEMTYDKNPNGYHWEGSLTDPALKSPIKAKFDLVKSGRDQHNYGLSIKSEIDYSGQPQKLISHSLKIERKEVGAHRRRRAAAHAVKFEAEMLATHPASNKRLRLWVNVDRKQVHDALLPVHTTLGVQTMNRQKKMVEYSFSADSDAMSFTELKLNYPETKMKARVDAVGDKHYKLAFYRNSDRASLLGELKKTPKGYELDVRDEKSGDVKLHASAEMPNEYSAEVELWHSERGKRIRDARLALELEVNNLLKAKAYIRPQLEGEIKAKAKQTIAEAKHLDQNSALKDNVMPLVESQKIIAKDIMHTLNTLLKSWTTEQREFANELGPEYKQMVDQIEENYELVEEAVLTAYDTAQQTVEQAIAAMPKSEFVQKLRQMREGGGDFTKQLTQMFEPVVKLFHTYSVQIEKLQKQFDEALDYLEKNLKIKEIKAALQDYQKKLERIDVVHEVLTKAQKLSRDYQMPEVERKLHEIHSHRQQYESKALQLYEKLKEILLNRLLVGVMSGATGNIVEKMSGERFDDIEMEKRWLDVIHFLRGKTSLETFSHDLWKKYVPTVKHIGPGEYEAEVTVPHGASSLREVLEDLHPERLLALKSSLLEKARSYALHPESDQFPASSIYTFKATTHQRFLPPFDSVAYVIAPDRFVTFDGRVFAFHSACEYLLATDLMHQQFSLIGSFKRERAGTELDAIKVEIQKDQIVMHLNGKAEVGGREVSMPWQKVDTMDGSAMVSIHREGDWTILKSYIGVEVKCNSVHHLCEIKLPGRMHAKSGGLLGCNDNEPYNDLDLIDGTHNNETNILAEHWAVQGSCRANEAPPLRSQENEKCEELFISSGSSLSDCFSQVNPQKFEQICSSDRPEHQCRAVSAFVHVCTNNGIDLSLPKPCVHCEDGLKMDEEIEVPHAGKGHDIVFVVQEKACLDPYKQNIARIAQTIGSQQRDARFGWIGYGGEGIHHSPHVHYGHDSALLDMNAFVRQTQHKFESESGFEPKPMCTLEAVKYAVEHFPFRLGAAKSIVLVTCKPCIGGSHSVSQSELQELVISHGITMHMLSLAKIKTSDKVQAVGMDADHLFSPAGSPVGDRSNVLKPSDVCSVVAQESHGTVFNIKHGANVISSKIQPKHVDSCTLCKCEVHELTVQNHCHPCDEVIPASSESAKFSGKVSDDSADEISLDELFMF